MQTEPCHEQVIRCQNESVKKDKRPSKSPCILERNHTSNVRSRQMRVEWASDDRHSIVRRPSDKRQMGVKCDLRFFHADQY